MQAFSRKFPPYQPVSTTFLVGGVWAGGKVPNQSLESRGPLMTSWRRRVTKAGGTETKCVIILSCSHPGGNTI